MARWLVLLWLLVERSEALSVGSTRRLELLREPTSDALCAPTKPELVEEVLSATAPLADAIDRLALPDLPHRWSDAELDELQWEPLATAARQQRQRLAALSPEEVRAHDLGEAHAIACDGLLWLVPATAGWGRSAPRGAYLTRCHLTDALILVADATADSEAYTTANLEARATSVYAMAVAATDIEARVAASAEISGSGHSMEEPDKD